MNVMEDNEVGKPTEDSIGLRKKETSKSPNPRTFYTFSPL